MLEFRRKIIDFGVLFAAITFRVSKFRCSHFDEKSSISLAGRLRRDGVGASDHLRVPVPLRGPSERPDLLLVRAWLPKRQGETWGV